MEKVGIQNVFWSFPSATSVKLEAELTKLNVKMEDLAKQEAEVTEKLEKERPTKMDCPEREALTAKLAAVGERVAGKKRELEKYSASDPERFEQLKKYKVKTRDGANRWVDNLFCMEKYLRTTMFMEKKQIQDFFVQVGVPKELDYIE